MSQYSRFATASRLSFIGIQRMCCPRNEDEQARHSELNVRLDKIGKPWESLPDDAARNQGAFDFSKREYDFEIGSAWNYSGPWEARSSALHDSNSGLERRT
jgi:hypothetical protein